MLAVPKKWLSVPLLFVLGGLVTALVAVFAERLGIDSSAGWGRGRIALLVAGILITLIAALAWRGPNKVNAFQQGIHSFVDKLPGTGSIRKLLGDAQLLDVLRNYWPVIPLCLLVVLIYVWLVSSGTWTAWVSPTRYYADLARGFQQGHLYLPIKVNPALLTSPDPYEPLPSGATQAPIDYAYYQGRYYLPWGPVPALIVLSVRGFFHRWLGDLQLTFGFICGLLLVQCLIAVLLWQRYFRSLPKWTLWMAVLLIGFAGPSPFMLNNYLAARIYEAAVTGGQFFLMAGLLMALVALGPPRREWALGFAGAFWALAIGTRLDLVLPIGVMVLMLSGWILRINGLPSRSIKAVALLFVPLGLGGALIGWYNWARFGNVLETGYFYQLAGLNLHKHWNERFSAAYVLPNLHAYVINPIHWKSVFPFVDVSPANGTGHVSFLPAVPDFYFSQIITGLLWLAPFVLFAVVPWARILASRIHGQHPGASAEHEPPRFLDWIQLTLSASSLITFIFLLLYFWAAMRFLEDFLPSLLLLSILGFWAGYESLRQNSTRRQIYSALGIFLAAASISISTLAAISINHARFGVISLLGVFSR